MSKPYAQHAKARPVRMTPGDYAVIGVIVLLLGLAVTGIVLGVIWS